MGKSKGKKKQSDMSLNQKTDKITSDVLGSWTGTGAKGDRPVQDADDL